MTSQTLGHYRILDKIGEGGMGAVYRAEDTRLGRVVALKVLSAERVADPQRLARFLQEARLASSLNHPNIATIHDVGEADGQHYIAMEFVEGESLRDRARGQPLPLAALLDLAMQIADALTDAHARGIVHRDIKGDNIRITPQSRAKILDFGLAKHLPTVSDATETLVAARTESGMIMGTVAYMSPEQALGQPVDARSDLFSFGVVLYEMTTGRPPFQGNSATSTIDKILHQAPVPPANLNHELPPVLEQIVLKLLEKNADDRYQSAREVLVDLRRLKRALDTGSLVATRIDARRATPASPRQRMLYVAVALLAFVAGAVGYRWGFPPPARPNTHFTAVTNFAGVEAQPTFSPDARSVAFVSDRGGQFDIWVSLVGAGSLVRITSDGNFKSRPRWSPDGSRIAYARLNESGLPDIWVVPALGGTPRRLLSEAADPAWSADGRSIAYVNRATNTIWVADANGGSARALTKEADPFRSHVQPTFSRDGRQLAFIRRPSGPRGELMVTDLASGKSRSLTNTLVLMLSPAWSADGRWIYFSSSRGGTVNIWRIAAAGGPPEQITAGQGDDLDLDLSADGNRIVFSTYRENVNLAELPLDGLSASTQGTLKWLTTDAARAELAPACSPDGRRIAYFSNRKGAENEGIWVADADGSNPIQLVDDERVNVYPRWTADGKSVVYATHLGGLDAELRRVGAQGGHPEKLVSIDVSEAWGGVALDGRLAFRSAGLRISVFDPKSNQTRPLEGIRGSLPRWLAGGPEMAYVVPARRQDDPQAGLWIYDFAGSPRQLFRGWVVWYASDSSGNIFLLEGKPNLNGPIWRVRPDGSPPVRTSVVVKINYPYWQPGPNTRFDAYPDGRRLVIEALEVHDADIGMIEGIQ